MSYRLLFTRGRERPSHTSNNSFLFVCLSRMQLNGVENSKRRLRRHGLGHFLEEVNLFVLLVHDDLRVGVVRELGRPLKESVINISHMLQRNDTLHRSRRDTWGGIHNEVRNGVLTVTDFRNLK